MDAHHQLSVKSCLLTTKFTKYVKHITSLAQVVST
jgi:hypothetical protein